MPARSLAVEFIGMPGSGKSTLSRRVAEILRREGLEVTQPSYPLAHGIPRARRWALKGGIVAGRLARRPLSCVRAIRAIRASGQTRWRTRMKLTVNWLLVAALRERGRQNGAVQLYDQGVLQAIWSIGYDGRDGAVALMAGLAGSDAPRPDVVVVVRAGEATVRRRLAARPEHDSRLEASRPADQGPALRRAAALLDEVVEAARRWGAVEGVPLVVEIVNDRDDGLDQAADFLARRLQMLFTTP